MKAEEFEQEWKRYCDSKGGGAVTMNIKDVAKHFAQWQKEQDQKELQIAEEHGILTGMNMEREQMMKDAIDTRIDKRLADMIGYTGSERVKIIIIKE